MPLASGLDAQLGIATETTYGTYVVPTRFYEFESESLKPDVDRVMVRGLGRARTQRGGQVVTYTKGGSGEASFPVFDRAMGLLLKHAFGAVATTGAGPTYTHTFTRGTTGTKGMFATVQVGVPDTSGTVRPFNFLGGKVLEFSFECSVDEPLMLSTTWDFKTFETTTALATASYAAAAIPLIYSHGAATIGGASVNIKSFSLNVNQGLDPDRRFISNTKLEPLPVGEFEVTGDLEFEFEALTRLGQLTGGTLLSNLQLVFTAGSHSLTLLVPQMIYTEGAPEVGGPEVVAEEMSWKALDNGTDQIITATYVSPDTTP